jgi:pilus assembly protein Flp/PilA
VLNRFLNDENGATAIEYGLIAALIAMSIIVGMGKFSSALNNLFMDNGSKINAGLNG